MFRATVRAATVINRISHFWSVKIGQGKLQILVINGETSLGSGPHIPTQLFRKNSSGPCQSLCLPTYFVLYYRCGRALYAVAYFKDRRVLTTIQLQVNYKDHYVETQCSSISLIQGSHCVILISRPENEVSESHGKSWKRYTLSENKKAKR